MTPTQRSLQFLRDQGYVAAIVERWNPHARIRQDLFGIIDIIGVRSGETLGVQTTSGSNVAARIKKISEAEVTSSLRAAGWGLAVHGWRKNARGRWEVRIVDVS